MTEAFPLIAARGTPRELGRQHGDQVRDRLRGFLDYLGCNLGLSRVALCERAARFRPLFARHCPPLVEEIEGLAEGAAVRFEEALAVQIRGEMAHVATASEGCTTFVIAGRATAGGEILIGQNSDMDPEMESLGYVLQLEPAGKPALMMWTFGGQLGYHGLNAAGVAHFANALPGGPRWQSGLPHYPLKRMMLEERSVTGILTLFKRMPVCSSANYVVCDPGRIADLEVTCEGLEIIADAGEGFIVHTNHYLCGRHATPANDAQTVPDSFARLERARGLVASRLGRIAVDDLKGLLADHAGRPAAICRHASDGPDHAALSARGKTVASLIAEPAAGRFHVARGNPCGAPYTVHKLGA